MGLTPPPPFWTMFKKTADLVPGGTPKSEVQNVGVASQWEDVKWRFHAGAQCSNPSLSPTHSNFETFDPSDEETTDHWPLVLSMKK